MKAIFRETFMMYTDNRRFEWDARKEQINFIKHGIHFKETTTAFDDPIGLTEGDLTHSNQEERQRYIGKLVSGEVVIVIFTMRPINITRIISARRANRKERRAYER